MSKTKLTDEQRFERYHEKNPHIFEAFKYFAFEAINNGKKTSHWCVVQRLRWEYDVVVDTEESYKISNNFIRPYAVLFMKTFPEHQGYFNLRATK